MPRLSEVVYTIREAAGKLDLHEQTLRNWERAGIIRLKRFGRNRARMFSSDDIMRLRRIKRFTGRGISLRGLKTLLSMNRRGNSQ